MFSLFRRALARNWRLAGLVAATVYVLVLLVIATTPRVYCSTALLNVTSGHESQMPSLVEVCRSEATLQRLVSSLGPEYAHTSRGAPTLLSVRQLQNWVDIAQPNRNTLSVRCQAKLPAQAQQLATRTAEICIEESRRLPADDASDSAIAEETARAKADWEVAAARLADTRKHTGNDATEMQCKAIEQQIAEVESKIQTVQFNLTAAEDRVASLAKQVAAAPETDVAQKADAALETKTAPESKTLPETESQVTVGGDIQGKIETLEVRERELAAIRSDDHPQLVALRQQLAELRAALAAPLQPKPLVRPANNVSRADLQLQLERELNEIAAFCELEEVLADEAAALKNDFEQVRSDQTKALARLEREVSAAQQRYENQLAESSRNDLAASTGAAILAVVQEPTLPTAPEYPQPTAMLTMALVGGALCGFGSALVAAMFRRVLRDCAQLEQVLDLPVVGVLPCSASVLAAAS